MSPDTENYQTLIKRELDRRVQKNPRYSLRLFAKRLGLAPSTLSDILNRRKNLSVGRAKEVSELLGLNEQQQKQFDLSVEWHAARSIEQKRKIEDRLRALLKKSPDQDLSVDHFRLISDWVHMAIVELTDACRIYNAKDVANKLGLQEIEARLALERLERLELIKKDSRGRYLKAKSDFCVSSPVKNAALRKFHEQSLERSKDSLEEFGPSDRITATETLSFSRSDLKEVDKAFESFVDRVKQIASERKDKDSVYHLSFNFFPFYLGGKK